MKQKVTTIARDENCDLYLDDNGAIATIEGADACAQIISAKMRTSLGEMQLNMQNGVPYFQTVFVDKSFIPIWQDQVIKMLEAIDFVTEVSSFDCNTDGDMLKYTAEIKTDNGTVTING